MVRDRIFIIDINILIEKEEGRSSGTQVITDGFSAFVGDILIIINIIIINTLHPFLYFRQSFSTLHTSSHLKEYNLYWKNITAG